MTPALYRVRRRRVELSDTVTLELEEATGQGGMQFAPGQFTMLYSFGVGEIPISISGDPEQKDTLVHTIRQVGAVTSVWLNGNLVVDNAILENFWDRKSPLKASGQVQLQTHGGEIAWRNIFVREIPAAEANDILAAASGPGFTSIFNGTDLEGWQGAVANYGVVDGAIRCRPGHGGTLYTKDEYSDFVVRLEFKVPPGGNNGLAIRYPGQGDPAYAGMTELQVLDNDAPQYAKLDPRQYHGSSYGMAAAARGFQRPTGEWNYQEVTVQGSKIRVELNGNVILNTDLSTITEYMANSPHPGKELPKGFFGFAGHGDAVEFRKVAIKPL